MRTIHSIADLLDCLKQIEREGQEGRRDNVRYYYRGEAEDYGPTGATPCIGRHDRLKKEAKIFREAERRLPDEFAACKSTFEKSSLLSVSTGECEWRLQMLVAAKVNHQKVEAQVCRENRTCVTKVTLK